MVSSIEQHLRFAWVSWTICWLRSSPWTSLGKVEPRYGGLKFIWLWVKAVLGSHFGVGEFTTHCRTSFSGWVESDVRWGLTGLGMTHGHF